MLRRRLGLVAVGAGVSLLKPRPTVRPAALVSAVVVVVLVGAALALGLGSI